MGIAWIVSEIIQTFIIFMIKNKILVTLNEGQGQYNEHMLHYPVWGSHRATFDDYDFNRHLTKQRMWRGKTCNMFEGHIEYWLVWAEVWMVVVSCLLLLLFVSQRFVMLLWNLFQLFFAALY